jgi:hypothetical protein
VTTVYDTPFTERDVLQSLFSDVQEVRQRVIVTRTGLGATEGVGHCVGIVHRDLNLGNVCIGQTALASQPRSR